MRTHTPRSVAAALALAVPLTLGLAACGGDESTETTSQSAVDDATTAAFNDADVAFAQDMVPHHAQALLMVEMADDREVPGDVRALMDQIEAAQAPEIDELNAMLESWGYEAVEADAEHSGHGGSGDHSGMTGMMSQDQLQELTDADDASFAELWLTMMIEHHEGAIEMSRTVIRDGKSGEARDLAERIIEAQEAEITTMQNLR